MLGEHINLEDERVHFFRKKTGKEFTVPAYAHAHDFLVNLRDAGRLVAGRPVFSWKNPRKALETACRNLGLPSHSPRTLRRTFIVHCLEKGVDPRVVASWQGHTDAQLVLTTYGNFISPDHAKAQAAKLV